VLFLFPRLSAIPPSGGGARGREESNAVAPRRPAAPSSSSDDGDAREPRPTSPEILGSRIHAVVRLHIERAWALPVRSGAPRRRRGGKTLFGVVSFND
jgi:hypothetical protein